ncbi:hypothetical protein [Halobacillus locisalis]|nr:hypothetical protein [Halobacillus locisalis]
MKKFLVLLGVVAFLSSAAFAPQTQENAEFAYPQPLIAQDF